MTDYDINNLMLKWLDGVRSSGNINNGSTEVESAPLPPVQDEVEQDDADFTTADYDKAIVQAQDAKTLYKMGGVLCEIADFLSIKEMIHSKTR